jgi:hypothetical protein
MSGVLIAAVVVVGIAAARPSARGLAGHWASRLSGQIYEVRPTSRDAFEVWTGGRLYARGRRTLFGVVVDAASPSRGTVEYSGRQIQWWGPEKEIWYFQGVKAHFGVGAPTEGVAAALCTAKICI